MSATNRGSERVESDYYPTPAWCVHRLLDEVRLPSGAWLEPCAGDGAIIRASRCVLTGAQWAAMELREEMRAPLSGLCPTTIGDFLASDLGAARYDVILTNPPYSLAMEFVQKSLAVSRVTAMLLRLNFLGSQERAAFFRAHPPSVYVMPNRPSFVGGRTDACEYAWFVWGLHPTPEIRVLGTTPRNVRCAP